MSTHAYTCNMDSIDEVFTGSLSVYMRRTMDFNKKTRILLVDDNFDHLLGIRELINIETNFEVIATRKNKTVQI